MNGTPSIYLIFTIGMLALAGSAAITVIILNPQEHYDLQAIVIIIGFLTPTITSLIGVLNSQKNSERIGKVQEDLKINNNLTQQIADKITSADKGDK